MNTVALPPLCSTEVADLNDLINVLGHGKIAQFKLAAGANSTVLDWTLGDWCQKFAKCTVQRHAISSEICKDLHRYLESKRDGELVTYPNFKSSMEIFSNETLSFAHLIEQMKMFQGADFQPTWDRDLYAPREARLELLRANAYGIINTRTMNGFDFKYPPIYEAWDFMYNFLWVGLSPGGLHLDPLDNTLIQLHGTKSVLIYEPELTTVIDGGHYPTQFNACKVLAPSTLENHRFLKFLPYRVVHLKPGDGVILPAGAYHAAFATSFDSISLNSFLVPRSNGPFPHMRSLKPTTFQLRRMKLGRQLYNLTGYKWLTVGPYEFI